VISTAIKKDRAKPEWIEAAVKSMTTLNKVAADVITGENVRRSRAGYAVHALTDVTGFGLIGHARELALASSVSIRLFSNKVPLLPGAIECVRASFIPGGLKANREFAECVVEYQNKIPEELKTLFFDPQTAGGLLISVAEPEAQALLESLRNAGIPAERIGRVMEKSRPLIIVI
jgi:selenide, water dikinase